MTLPFRSDRQWAGREKWRVLAVVSVLLAVVPGCLQRPLQMKLQGEVTAKTPPDNTASRLQRRILPHTGPRGPAVAVIELDGLLVNRNLSGFGSLGENPVALFREKLNAATNDPDIQALVLRVNSPGGGVAAVDMMRQDLHRFRECRGIPVIACLMDLGTAGAYYVATEADTIVAHPTSVTGGIGVILNAYNLEDTLGQFNVVPLPIKAGEKIDMPSVARSLDPDERVILEEIAEEFHERFREQVSRTRPGLRATADDFDGRVFSARRAQQLGLVDHIGYIDDALQMARQAAGLAEGSRVVMYRRTNDRAFTPYDTTPNVPLQNSMLPLSIPGLDRSTLPTFLYLWQPDPSYLTSVGGK
jgi:protease IV